MKTYVAKKEDVKRKWFTVNAKGKILGRLATEIATILIGKNKSTYTPHVDGGDGVVIINADRVVVTGQKLKQKLYTRYSGYPGGLKSRTLEVMMKERPTEVIRHAVSGMLPKNKLGRRMLSRLKVYVGAEHPHEAQVPETLEV